MCLRIAIVAILRRQPHAMIYVGDPHQSIYRFRGAVNAIASVHADHTYSLTRACFVCLCVCVCVRESENKLDFA